MSPTRTARPRPPRRPRSAISPSRHQVRGAQLRLRTRCFHVVRRVGCDPLSDAAGRVPRQEGGGEEERRQRLEGAALEAGLKYLERASIDLHRQAGATTTYTCCGRTARSRRPERRRNEQPPFVPQEVMLGLGRKVGEESGGTLYWLGVGLGGYCKSLTTVDTLHIEARAPELV